MVRIALILCCSLLAGGTAVAEVLQTEPPCEVSVAHSPDPDVAADDLNGREPPPPVELGVRRDINGKGAWFLEALAATIRIDPQTGAISGPPGLVGGQTAKPTCD